MTTKSDEEPEEAKVLKIEAPLVISGDNAFIVEQGQAVAVLDAVLFSCPKDDHPVAKDDLHVGVRDVPDGHFKFVLREIDKRLNEAKALHEKVHALHRASLGKDP